MCTEWLCVNCFPSGSWGWLAAVPHFLCSASQERITPHMAPGEKTQIQTANVCHFYTIMKSKSPKSNHHKLGTVHPLYSLKNAYNFLENCPVLGTRVTFYGNLQKQHSQSQANESFVRKSWVHGVRACWFLSSNTHLWRHNWHKEQIEGFKMFSRPQSQALLKCFWCVTPPLLLNNA